MVSNGGRTPDVDDKNISRINNIQVDDEMEMETSLNNEIDVLTRDSMNLGLVLNSGKLKLDFGDLSGIFDTKKNKDAPERNNKGFSEL